MRASDTWTPARVRRVVDLSPTVRSLELVLDGGVRPWTAGAHLGVALEVDGRRVQRHYSLIGLPGATGAAPADDADDGGEAYRIAVKRALPGRGGSRAMWGLAAGDRIDTLPPQNHFELALPASAPPPPTLLLAGGIGVTPLVGMAQQLARRGAEVRMVYSARSADEWVLADLLRAALGKRLTLAMGARPDLAAEIATLPPHGQLVVCGPHTMLDAVRSAWAQADRPAAALRFETFGAGDAPQPFRVHLPRHGLTLDVPPGQSLLDALEARGVPVLSDCRRGECGLCALTVLSVSAGTLDHRDVFLSGHEQAAGKSLCACVSRVSGAGACVVLDTAYRAGDDSAESPPSHTPKQPETA
jgi:vanillate O-demethylase ferredoxin subunit